jgi:tRNA (guanine-N7-)-methyltransferase
VSIFAAMGQKKLVRFNEIKEFPNVLEYPEDMQGKWSSFFKNDHPVTLELACGKGEYAVGLGEMYPERNFIGVDIKGNRIWRGAKTALEKKLYNVAFLRTEIDKITNFFASAVKNIKSKKKINPSEIPPALPADLKRQWCRKPQNG